MNAATLDMRVPPLNPGEDVILLTIGHGAPTEGMMEKLRESLLREGRDATYVFVAGVTPEGQKCAVDVTSSLEVRLRGTNFARLIFQHFGEDVVPYGANPVAALKRFSPVFSWCNIIRIELPAASPS